MRHLGILIAARTEAKDCLAEPGFGWREAEEGLFRSSKLPLSLSLSGVGKAYAAWGLARLAPESSAIVSLGTSGSLGHHGIGSCFLVEEFVEHDMCVEALGFKPGITPYGPLQDPYMRPSSPGLKDLVERALAEIGMPYKEARAMSGDEFIASAERAELKKGLFGAELVDMECAILAKLCLSRAKLPMLALRLVSDNADHEAGAAWAERAVAIAKDISAICLALGRAWAACGQRFNGAPTD